MKSFLIAAAAVLASTSVSAFATSTFSYDCKVNISDSSTKTKWLYSFTGSASISRSEGFAGFQRAPKLGITRFNAASNGKWVPVTLIKGADLALQTSGTSFKVFELPGSTYGLFVNFDIETGTISIRHFITNTHVLDSQEKDVVCNNKEVG